MNDDKKVGMNEQDAPRKEGQYGNTSANPAAEENVSMGISQMNEDRQGQSDRNQSTPNEKQSPNTDGGNR